MHESCSGTFRFKYDTRFNIDAWRYAKLVNLVVGVCICIFQAFLHMSSAVRSVILTSGTLSPMESFQSELGVPFPIQLEASHVISAKQVFFKQFIFL